jgi:predicted enzyme related to lactoylglutathione lyase
MATTVTNPVFHFEIPVLDMERAFTFYQDVLELKLRREKMDGYDMAFFPRDDDMPGCSGALAAGDVYKPSHQGSLIYFDVPDIDQVLLRAANHGAKVLYEKTNIGEAGYVAELEDSEGNRIALTQGPN